MERKKILLILVLFLGVSLADEVPRYFRGKSLPGKLNIRLWKKNKAMDQPQPESEDTRNMNTKQTEESGDIEVRHKLPIQETNEFLPENDVPVTEYCRTKVVEKVFSVISHRGRTYEPLIKRYPETFCDPDGDIEIIRDVPHQKCLFEQHYQNYCFTRKEDVTIPYLSTSGRPRLYSHIIKMRTGCRCAEPDVRRKR